jgi:hypothetical protein
MKKVDQQRNAERIPLTEPLDASIESAEGKIVELSLIGARVEHFNRLSMNSPATVQFKWKGKTFKLKGKVARTEMRSIRGKPGYLSGVTFAETPETAPQELRWIMSTFVETIDTEAEIPSPAPTPASPPPPNATAPIAAMKSPPAAAPSPAFASPPPPPAAPPPPKKPVAKTPTPPPTPAPFLSVDDDVEEIDAAAELPPYVHCEFLEDGGWEKTRTSDAKQPISGFTMLAPESDDEVDDFCRTYEMADPETQRMIRLSFELGIAQFRRK